MMGGGKGVVHAPPSFHGLAQKAQPDLFLSAGCSLPACWPFPQRQDVVAHSSAASPSLH